MPCGFMPKGMVANHSMAGSRSFQYWGDPMNASMVPMWVLSGAYFTNERFPDWMQPLVQALPLTALVDALRGIYNEGATLAGVAGELGILAVWGLGSFALAARRFRWQ